MKIEPMLAKEYDHKWVTHGFFLQPKLNGHRIIWDGEKLWTRQGKLVVSVPGIVEQLQQYFKNIPVDGELYCHGMSFQQITQTGRKTVNIKDDENLCMYIYDLPEENLEFKHRWHKLTVDYNKVFKKASRLKLVDCIYQPSITKEQINNPQKLNIFGKTHEGTMLRNENGFYKFGKRSSDLLKIKKFQDTEATIIGVTQLNTFEKIEVPEGTPGSRKKSDGTYVKNGKASPQEMIGALVCKLQNNIVFEIGSGFTHEERKKYWKHPPIDKIVTFQYQELSPDGVPLFPSFLRMKEDL